MRMKEVVKRSLVRNQVVYYLPVKSFLCTSRDPEEAVKANSVLSDVIKKLRDA